MPNSKELKKLALMGFDLNFIFGKVAPLAQAEKTLIENYRAADESGQKALRRVGTALAKQVSKAATGTDDD